MLFKSQPRVIIAVSTLLCMCILAVFLMHSCWVHREVSSLIFQIKTGDNHACDEAASELARIGKPAVKPLLVLLHSKDMRMQCAAALAFGRMGAPAIEPLKSTLHDKSFDVKLNAVIALGGNKDPRSIDILISAFKDKSQRVGRCAALSLWHKGSRAVDPLLVALNDKDPDVRCDAALAFYGIKDKRAVLPLIEKLRDEDNVVRTFSAQALGQIGDQRAIRPLQAILNNPHEYHDARYRAGISLKQIITATK